MNKRLDPSSPPVFVLPRQKPEVQSTRPDSAARQALWTVAGCDAKMVQAECYRKGQPKTQNTRAPQRTSREWEEGDVQHEHIRSHVSYTLRPHVKRALELSLSDGFHIVDHIVPYCTIFLRWEGLP